MGRQDSYHDVVMSEQLQLGQVHCHCGWAQSGIRWGRPWRRGQDLGVVPGQEDAVARAVCVRVTGQLRDRG